MHCNCKGCRCERGRNADVVIKTVVLAAALTLTLPSTSPYGVHRCKDRCKSCHARMGRPQTAACSRLPGFSNGGFGLWE